MPISYKLILITEKEEQESHYNVGNLTPLSTAVPA
jgi:hypothetical protein